MGFTTPNYVARRTPTARLVLSWPGMNVEEMMNAHPYSCRPHDNLSVAARIMWEQDCGWVPVVDDAGRAVGAITDRDICMATLTRSAAPALLAVEGTMSTNLHTCVADDPIENALAAMRNYGVRRLPVVDDTGKLVGLVSLSDLSRRAMDPDCALRPRDVALTLASICEPRSADPAA